MDLFSTLPVELVLNIFKHVELKFLGKCAEVSHYWYEALLDYSVYENLCLKAEICSKRTLKFIKTRCRNVKKMEITVPNSDPDLCDEVSNFLQQHCQQATHLKLMCTSEDVLLQAGLCKHLTTLHLNSYVYCADAFNNLSNINQLVTLNLSNTPIEDNQLIEILKANINLRHINIDYCTSIQEVDNIIAVMVNSHPELTEWSSNSVRALTTSGATLFSKLAKLEKLSLKSCKIEKPGKCLKKISLGCPNLKTLDISSWEGIREQDLLPIALNLKNLNNLCLRSVYLVTENFCNIAFSLPKLQVLDIRSCGLSYFLTDKWRTQYPNVSIDCDWKFGTWISLPDNKLGITSYTEEGQYSIVD